MTCYPALLLDPTDTLFTVILFLSADEIYTERFDPQKNLTVTLLPSIDTLLQNHTLQIQDLQKILVCTGPGSYTSLRITLATTNALTYATKIPLYGFSLFELEIFAFCEEFIALPFKTSPNTSFATINLISKFDTRLTRSFTLTSADDHLIVRKQEEIIKNPYTLPLHFHHGYAEISTTYRQCLREAQSTRLETIVAFARKCLLTPPSLYFFENLKESTTLLPLYYRGPSITVPKLMKL